VPPITLRDVRRAVAGAELELVYQPEVDLRTGHIASVEALVRWRHPELGMVPPAQFIPLAERSGQMREITNVVIDQALLQATRWAGARWDRQPLPIWVNLSASELSDPQLDRRVAALLDQHGVAPSQLGIEVTETAPITDKKLALSTLYTFREMGIRLAIDDFGTGYSSLSHIKDLPVDIVKIDRRFVEGVAHETADAAIVTAVVTIAHALRRVVVAEGVEDIEQQKALNALGCDLGQGYLFSSPQPAHCVDVLLSADRDLALRPGAGRTLPIRLPMPRSQPSVRRMDRQS
jgi:EAL domain-containing protein (putative c-di-GMP-specific phosphodiesterase class I)